MIFKKIFATALALLALAYVNALSANAQSSCPVTDTYGVRPPLEVDKTLRAQIEVIYFTTDDPNAFLSERAGAERSASYASLSANQFVARLDSLEKAGVASIRKRESAAAFLGEVAELNLERNRAGAGGRAVNASHGSASALSGLDRRTEIHLFRGSAEEEGRYRVSLLSWFVDARADGGRQTVDYDAVVLLKPGQTAVFKLMSAGEVKRTGGARSHVAVTLRSVNSPGPGR
jgi:hypothetical protein